MMKIKNLVLFFAIILLILCIPNVVNATTNYESITWATNKSNIWIDFPGSITRSLTTDFFGDYYSWSGKFVNKSTSENITFQTQYLCIGNDEFAEIKKKSDETPDDNEFIKWFNNWSASKINENNWTDLTNMNFTFECTISGEEEHFHLILVKVIEGDVKNVVWQGYSNEFSVMLASRKEAKLESIEITTPPTKTDYTVGEVFDNAGMVITAKYSDGSSKVVTNYTYKPQEALKTTDTAITIEYTENNISKETTQGITVKEKTNQGTNDTNNVVLEGIEITTPPTKTDYTVGEVFDNAGMVITAKYSDGSSKVVTNYTYKPQEALKTTDTAITIVYSENNISKEVSQEIKVEEKEQTNNKKEEPKTEETKKEDTTTAPGVMPYTGGTTVVVISMLAVVAIGIIAYKKNKELRGI